MKNLFSISFILSLLILDIPLRSAAQRPFKDHAPELSLGASWLLPVGNMIGRYKGAAGAELQLDFSLNEKVVFVTADFGYQQLLAENNSPAAKDPKMMPLKVGLRFVPTENIYLQADAGASVLLNSSSATEGNPLIFIFSNEIGYRFRSAPGNSLAAGLVFWRNAGISKNLGPGSFFGLKMAYGLTW